MGLSISSIISIAGSQVQNLMKRQALYFFFHSAAGNTSTLSSQGVTVNNLDRTATATATASATGAAAELPMPSSAHFANRLSHGSRVLDWHFTPYSSPPLQSRITIGSLTVFEARMNICKLKYYEAPTSTALESGSEFDGNESCN